MIYYNGEITQAYIGDAGFDLYSQEDVSIFGGQVVKVDTGVKLELPDHIFAQVVPRSGLSSKGKMVVTGTIDSRYRDKIGVVAYCLYGFWKIRKGDRVAQLVFFNKVPQLPQHKEEILANTERGLKGFGSSGR